MKSITWQGGMCMKTLRTVVVGLGRIGWQFHAQRVALHEGFELTAVVDPVQERLDEAAARFGVKGLYTDLAACLKAERLDLVVIASPTQFHCEQAVAAFAHGCDVFCDKPMAASLAEADRMMSAMAEYGRKLMLYQPQRARAEVVALRDVISRNLIGPVYMIKRSTSTYTRRNDWQSFRKYGGDMLNNSGSHFVDQCLYLAGSYAKRVHCTMRRIASLGDADDVVYITIETESDTVLVVEINTASGHSMRPWHILGQYGSIVADDENRAWHVRYFRPEALSELGADDGLAARDRKYGSGETIPWREETVVISDFQAVDYYEKCYEYFALDRAPYVPVADSREVMRVLDACRKDAGADWGYVT